MLTSAGSSALAADVLRRACERHGGDDAFARTTKLELRLSDLGGLIPWLKGLERSFPRLSAVDLFPHERRAVFFDYPSPGDVTVFHRGRVGTGTTPSFLPLNEPHRPSFAGLAKWRLWRPEDAAYFFGYALLDYVSFPFSLRGLPVVHAAQNANGAELWFRFPENADTHSSVQGFFFDASGLMVRHDYRAEILGAVFNGAHQSGEHVRVGELLIATTRVVYAKLWHYPSRLVLPVPVLRGRLLPRD